MEHDNTKKIVILANAGIINYIKLDLEGNQGPDPNAVHDFLLLSAQDCASAATRPDPSPAVSVPQPAALLLQLRRRPAPTRPSKTFARQGKTNRLSSPSFEQFLPGFARKNNHKNLPKDLRFSTLERYFIVDKTMGWQKHTFKISPTYESFLSCLKVFLYIY